MTWRVVSTVKNQRILSAPDGLAAVNVTGALPSQSEPQAAVMVGRPGPELYDARALTHARGLREGDTRRCTCGPALVRPNARRGSRLLTVRVTVAGCLRWKVTTALPLRSVRPATDRNCALLML